MANEPIHGKVGSAVFGATTFANLVSWTIDLNATTSDSTAAHASNAGKLRVVGFMGGTASIVCRYNADADPEAKDQAAEATLKLYRISGDLSAGYYNCTAVKCTGYEISEPKGDVVMVTYNFIITGVVTIETA